MNEVATVTVRGSTVLEVDPEIARIGVTITARDADRAKALRNLDERAVLVDRLVAGFGEAIERTETTGIRVSPQLKSGKPRERVAGYVAVVQQTITVIAFDRLGELVAQLADQELTDVAGPWWALRTDSPVYRRARVDAVRDAVQRAQDYAGAVGSKLTALVELADTGLLSEGEAFMPAAAAAAPVRAFAGGPPAEFTFDITPMRQTVRAAVEARFRISPPSL